MKEQKTFRKFSEKIVLTRTGKGWEEWFVLLDQWNVQKHGHTLTAKHLREKYHLSPWWAQHVTIRYEYEKGLR